MCLGALSVFIRKRIRLLENKTGYSKILWEKQRIADTTLVIYFNLTSILNLIALESLDSDLQKMMARIDLFETDTGYTTL